MKDENSLFTSKNLTISYFTVLLSVAVLYAASCAPAALWQDSGMYQYRIWHNDIEGNLGLALSHPLYHIIGIAVKYIPFGEFGYRVNLISAIFAAISVANIFLLLRLWLGRIIPAAIAAATLALSHTMWQSASIAEVYTLYTALFTTELIFLLQYFRNKNVGYLYLLGLFNGLAIANHMWAVIAFACYLVFLTVLLVQRQIRLRHFGVIVLLWVTGAAPYEYLIIKNIIETGDFTTTLASAFFGRSWQGDVLNVRLSAKIVKENLILMAYNFPTPNVLFFFVGLFGLKQVSPSRSFVNILLALLILFFVFAFRYTVPDRYAFFMPFYCLASIFIGVGMCLFFKRYPRRLHTILILVFALLPLAVYEFLPVFAERLEINLGTKRTIPYRNDYIYFLRPSQRENNGPELFANEALSSIEKEAIIIADGTTVYPLWYVQQVKAIFPDIKVVSQHGSYKNPTEFPTADTICELMAKQPVYIVSPVAGYCPQFLLERYEFEQQGVLWKVIN